MKTCTYNQSSFDSIAALPGEALCLLSGFTFKCLVLGFMKIFVTSTEEDRQVDWIGATLIGLITCGLILIVFVLSDMSTARDGGRIHVSNPSSCTGMSPMCFIMRRYCWPLHRHPPRPIVCSAAILLGTEAQKYRSPLHPAPPLMKPSMWTHGVSRSRLLRRDADHCPSRALWLISSLH
jgi:hypothetical protein